MEAPAQYPSRRQRLPSAGRLITRRILSHTPTPTIKSVTVALDARSVRLVVDRLEEGHIHELHLPGVRSAKGQPVLHSTAYYTLNYLPEK